jgi:hypothetical protein
MSGAVLRVDGENFDPDSALTSSSLQPYRIYRKGDPASPMGPRREKYNPSGGICFDVSSADGLLSAQAEDAVAFLTKYYADLVRLRDNPAVADMRIDFGYDLRLDGESVMVQCDFLPPELLRLAGELRIGFELSLYPRSEGSAQL